MAKLRHVALMVPNPRETAEFFKKAFDLEEVGETEVPFASGVFLSDGTMNLAILNFKEDEAAGVPWGKDAVCINHIGFWVDDVQEADEKIRENGGSYMLGMPEDPENVKNSFYEVKYKDPNGIVFDVSTSGWLGSKK